MYKCQTAEGKTAFQEIPCATAEKQTDVRTFAAPAAPASNERSPALSVAINQAIVGSYPIRGMNLKELQAAVGDPSRVNTGDYQGGYTEQRIYERAGGTIYVYTENGIVRSIQTSEIERYNGCGSAKTDLRKASASCWIPEQTWQARINGRSAARR